MLYYFGQRLHKELDVPVGLINSSWGGSPIEPGSPGTKTGGMYNGMIAPVQPFAIRGVIWYQGETNVSNGLQVCRQDEGPDRRLAAGVGLRLPLLLRPDRPLCRATSPAAARRCGRPRRPA